MQVAGGAIRVAHPAHIQHKAIGGALSSIFTPFKWQTTKGGGLALPAAFCFTSPPLP